MTGPVCRVRKPRPPAARNPSPLPVSRIAHLRAGRPRASSLPQTAPAPGTDGTGRRRGELDQWQNPPGIDVAQALCLNRTPTPVWSQIRSAGWLRKAGLNEIVSKLGLLPPVSALALSTTMPPELNFLPALPVTLL